MANYFVHRHWQMIEKVELYSGVWCHQALLAKYSIRAGFTVIFTSLTIPMVARLVKEWGVNFEIVLEGIIYILIFGALLLKITTSCIYSKEKQKIYEKVNDHFRTITEPHEAYVLCKSAEDGKKFCIKYSIIYCITAILFLFIPVVKMIFDYSMGNGDMEKIFPYYTDYGVIDEDKYCVPLLFHQFFESICYGIQHNAYDFGFIMSTRHVCALFEIVKIRLQEASGFLEEFEWDMLDFTIADNKAYDLVTEAIDLHNKAFEMVSMIEKMYTFPLLVILLINTFLFSGGIYLVALNSNQPLNLLRYFSAFVLLFVHYGMVFSHGQMIINSSSSVFDACYNVKWYLASPKTRRLLCMMMSRSSRPSVITGGGFFIISLETCGKMTKGGYSYLSVFTQR